MKWQSAKFLDGSVMINIIVVTIFQKMIKIQKYMLGN